jgi:lysozyme family protein
MDCCVHSGPGTAIKLLQKIVGVNQDGVIGPNTIKGVHNANPVDVFYAYQRERILFLARQVYNDPTKLKYLVGWLNRVLGITR